MVTIVAWTVAGSTARAAVTNDREYRLGEGAGENGSAGAVVGSGHSIAGAGDTLDGIGPSGAFLDLEQTGSPVYADVFSGTKARPGTSSGDLGVQLDGSNDVLQGIPLNRPDAMAGPTSVGEGFPLVSGYPHNYNNITARGLQLWVYPDAAKVGNGRQGIVQDTFVAGGVSITADGNWTQTNAQQILLPGTVPVVGDTWYHVMHHISPSAGANQFTSAVYIDGIAISVNEGSMGPTDAVVGLALLVGAEDRFSLGFVVPHNFFQGVVDELEMYVYGDNGTNYGTFDLFADNDWIANEIATTVPGGVLTGGDVNKDGSVNGDGTGAVGSDDVSAFIAGWRSENVVQDITVGDWLTWDNGDLNHDGRTSFADWFILRANHPNGPALNLSALVGAANVPEPSSMVLAGLALAGIGLGRFRSRKGFSIGSRSITALSGLLVVVAAAAPTSAAPMTFFSLDYMDGAVSTNGTLVGALNAACGTESGNCPTVDVNDYTVNGVLFTAITDDTANAGPVALSGGVSVDIFSQASTSHQPAGPPESVLTDVFFFSSGAGTGDLTFTGLSDGQLYELQLIMGDTRGNALSIWGDQTDSSGESDIFVDHGNSLSKLVTGVFTGDATGAQSLFVQVNGGFPGHFNAIQLREVEASFEPRLRLTVDRDLGTLTLSNNTGGTIDIAGLGILSSAGALAAGNWNSISGNYDASANGGDESVSTDEWIVFAETHNDLSESALGTGSLAHGESVNLDGGALGAGAWLRTPTEDVSFEYLDANTGEELTGHLSYTGERPLFGDLNGDGTAFGLDDFTDHMLPNLVSDLSTTSVAVAYLAGDLNPDFTVDRSDFRIFKNGFLAAGGSAAALSAAVGVPEPAAALLLLTAMGLALPVLGRRRRCCSHVSDPSGGLQ